MQIYFAGSIRGGREDTQRYQELIELLRAHGSILTEHIGSKTLPVSGEQLRTDEEIFQRDSTWLSAADIVVAEVTTPSLGVGYELARAETLGKRTEVLYRPQNGRRLSAMIAGNPAFSVHEYETTEEAKIIFDSIFTHI